MQAANRLFVKSPAWSRTPRLAACGLAALGLAACQTRFPNPLATYPVDPKSPIAAEVAKAADADGKYPSFLDIPDLPKDVRPVEGWAKSVSASEAAGEDLARQTAPANWSLAGTEGFAGQAQRATTDEEAPRAGENSEAYAQRLRERATPPPSTR